MSDNEFVRVILNCKTSIILAVHAFVQGPLPCFWENLRVASPGAVATSVQVTEWRNIAKTTVWFSSKMEKFMIQMTWPDDGVLDDVWVKVSVLAVGQEAVHTRSRPVRAIYQQDSATPAESTGDETLD